MRWCIFVLFVLVVRWPLSAVEEQRPVAGTIWALIVQDSSTQSLNDVSSRDVARVRESLRNIAQHTGLALRTRTLHREKASFLALSKWASTIPPHSNDVVFVYYSGAGTKAPNPKNRWPAIALNDLTKKLLSENELMRMFQLRHPRLLVICFDCYDRFLDLPQGSDPSYFATLIPRCGDLPGLKNLFLMSQGVVKVCSAARGAGGLSFQDGSKGGGLFTDVFLMATRKLAPIADIQWHEILSTVIEGCREGKLDPLPLAEIHVTPVGQEQPGQALVEKHKKKGKHGHAKKKHHRHHHHATLV